MKIKYLFILLIVSITNILAQDFTGIKICINPGHGGYDSNDRYIAETGFWESDGNLDKGLALRNILQSYNASVIMTRTTNTTADDLPLSQIVQIANSNNVDYMHSIHSNAYNSQSNYTLLLFHGYDNNPTYPDAKTMGSYMTDEIWKAHRTTAKYNRGDFDFYGNTSGLGVLRGLNMPGTLSEGSFHDYIPESWRLRNSAYKEHEAVAISKAFITYFNKSIHAKGEIAGVVRDVNQAVSYYFIPTTNDGKKPINNLKVTLQPGNIIYNGDTYNNGFFLFNDLNPGTYTLTYEATGYSQQTSTVIVNANQTTFADKYLTPDGTTTLNVVFDDFETSVGHFDKAPTYSGSTTGIAAASSSARSTEVSLNSTSSLKVLIKDDATSTSNWVVRLLSGTGSAANNNAMVASGYVGFWLNTTSAPSGSQVAITVDDVAGGTELSSQLNVINDGQWHLYQWGFQQSGWTSFASGNGVINGPTCTLDAIMFYAANASPDCTFYLDDVTYNQSSQIPVELSSFNCFITGNNIQLNWRTETETNCLGFEIQRCKKQNSTNEQSIWKRIDFVSGHGTSTLPETYFFRDENLESGNYDYRLKIIDLDGRFEYSYSVATEIIQEEAFYLSQNYPNPFNPSTVISYQLPTNGFVTLKVYDVLGKEVASLVNSNQEAGVYNVDFNAGNLSAGTYIYKLTAGEFTSVKKLLLLK